MTDYKCPNCKGEFMHWMKKRVDGELLNACPFCGIVEGRYNPRKTVNPYYPYGKWDFDDSTAPYPQLTLVCTQ